MARDLIKFTIFTASSRTAQLFGHPLGRQGLAMDDTVRPNSGGRNRLHLFHQTAVAARHCPRAVSTYPTAAAPINIIFLNEVIQSREKFCGCSATRQRMTKQKFYLNT